MILFHTPPYAAMAAHLRTALGAGEGVCCLHRFPNGELSLRVGSGVERIPCLVLGSVAPPDENLLAILQLIDTLRRHGAAEVTLLLPYFGYSRHDRPDGRASTFALIGALLRAAGVRRIITVDVHNPLAAHELPVETISLSPAPLFATRLGELPGAALVAPDRGALPRCEAIKIALRGEYRIVSFRKQRTDAGVSSTLEGEPGRENILIDDMLDTGTTLILAAEALVARATHPSTVVVTHGLFTGTEWPRLWRLGVQRIITTDTVPIERGGELDGRIERVSVVPLLSEFLRHNP